MPGAKVGGVTIERAVVGPIETNCYVLSRGEGCIVIDPGDEFHTIWRLLGGREVAAIVVTHRHPDHITALAQLKEATGALVYAHALDADAIEDPSGDPYADPSLHGAHVDMRLEDGDKVEAAGISLAVLYTPGHTIGGMSLVLAGDDGTPGALFSGDTIFAGGSFGRTDFPTGDYRQLAETIRTKIAPLPDGVLVFPGHGPSSSMAVERRLNPCMRR